MFAPIKPRIASVAVGLAGLLPLVVYVALAFSWFERGMVLPVVEPIVIVLLTLAAAVTLRPRLTLRPSAEGFTR